MLSQKVNLYRILSPFSERNKERYFVAKKKGELCAYLEVSNEGETFVASGDAYRHIMGAYCVPEHRRQSNLL